MKEYHKIESIFRFDNVSKKHIIGFYYNDGVEILKNNKWIISEKIDGMNLRIYWNGHTLAYGGRTDNANFSQKQKNYIIANLVNDSMATIFEQQFMEKEVIVYGELYGVDIQNGGLYTDGNGIQFRVFDIEIDGIFLKKDNALGIANYIGYEFVPIIGEMTLPEAIKLVEDTELSFFSKAKLEGVVATPVGDFRDRLGKRIIVKIKKRDIEL